MLAKANPCSPVCSSASFGNRLEHGAGVDQLTAMVHGAFQQSLESPFRRGRDPPGMPAEPRRTSRLVRMVAFSGRDETVDAANLRRLSRSVRCPARIRCEQLAGRFGPSAVDAWPERTDAVLTELSGR